MSAGFFQVAFCNCCASGCDCGCVESCRLVEHRPTADRPATNGDAS